MATKKFPSEMSSRGTVLGTDKILIYNATTGASDEVCTVAELLKMLTDIYPLSGLTTGKIPYKSASVLADSLISTDGTNVDIGAILRLTGTDGKLFLPQTPATFHWIGDASQQTGIMIVTTNDNSSEKVSLYANNNFGLIVNKDGYVGIGKTDPGYLLELGSDSAGKPGAGGLWTVVSDERIKKDIELADLDICYNTIKNIPLKRYAWADGVYSEGQVPDRHNLGWIAQDVQKYFSKAVTVKPFTKNEKIEDGVEEYQEQDFIMEDKKVTSIEIVNGSPVQVTKTVQEKVLLFDELPVKDELGKVVLENGKPLLAKVPKMVTKTRPKFRQEVIEDCLDLNSGQLNAALYGAVQACMLKIESLEKEVALLKQ